MLFVKGTGADVGLFAIRTDGTGQRMIIDAHTAGMKIGSLEVPDWSPDGTQIVVSISEVGEGDHRKLWIVNADGTGLRPLTQGPTGRDEGFPQWSPDGTKVAFMRWIDTDDGGEDVRPITVVDVTTGAETELGVVSSNGTNGWSWSPDSQSILSVPADSSQIVVLPVDGSAATSKLPSVTIPGAASWQRTAD